jgi:hypothetical protein
MTTRPSEMVMAVGALGFLAAAIYELLGREPSALAQGLMLAAIGLLLIGAGFRGLQLRWLSGGAIPITKDRHPVLFRVYLFGYFVLGVTMLVIGAWAAVR